MESDPVNTSAKGYSQGSLVVPLISIIVVILIAVGGYIGHNVYEQQLTTQGHGNTMTNGISVSTTPVPSGSTEPFSYTGWQTYTDSTNQVSFLYPSKWDLKQEQNPSGAYFSPSDTTNQESIEYAVYDNYNTIASFIRYLSTPVQDQNDFRSHIIVGGSSMTNINGKIYTLVPLTFKQPSQGTSTSSAGDYIFLTKTKKVAVMEFNDLDAGTVMQVLSSATF